MNPSASTSILVVGAGHCGGRATQCLRELGFDGAIHLVGNEPGLPYERPPLSKDALICTKHLDELDLMTAETMDELGVNHLHASVQSVDVGRKLAHLSDGRTLGYDALLFANGGSPKCLPIPGADLPGVLSLRTKQDALQLSKRLLAGSHIAIIGGGFMGLELAATARKLRCEVTLVEAGLQLMGGVVPWSVAERVAAVHASKGVRLHCNVTPSSIRQDKKKLAVALSNHTTVWADTVLVCIGIAPRVQIAQAAGIAVGRGILVDSHLRTNVANVYAAGDVAEFRSPASSTRLRQETWNNAESQARVVAQNLTGANVRYATQPWMWSDQYEYQLQISGNPGAGARSVAREMAHGDVLIFYLDGKQQIVGTCGWGLSARMLKDLKAASTLVKQAVHARPEHLSNPAIALKSLL